MGLITLDNFRSEARVILNRDVGSILLNRWINFAYLSLASAVDFEELDEIFNFSTVVNTREYTFTPVTTPNHLGTKYLYNETTSRILEFVPKIGFFSYRAYIGMPHRWTLDRDKIVLHPTPDGINTIRVVYKKPPPHLSADGDTTILPSTWDLAVVMLMAAHAFIALDEFEKAVIWEQKAQNYISTRITSEGLDELKLVDLIPSTEVPEVAVQ